MRESYTSGSMSGDWKRNGGRGLSHRLAGQQLVPALRRYRASRRLYTVISINSIETSLPLDRLEASTSRHGGHRQFADDCTATWSIR